MRNYCLYQCRGRCATCATKDSLDAEIYESGVRAGLAKADWVLVVGTFPVLASLFLRGIGVTRGLYRLAWEHNMFS